LSLVVECSILVELVVHGGIAHFLVVHREKSNYPYKLEPLILRISGTLEVRVNIKAGLFNLKLKLIFFFSA
jgi:hypothetical protein